VIFIPVEENVAPLVIQFKKIAPDEISSRVSPVLLVNETFGAVVGFTLTIFIVIEVADVVVAIAWVIAVITVAVTFHTDLVAGPRDTVPLYLTAERVPLINVVISEFHVLLEVVLIKEVPHPEPLFVFLTLFHPDGSLTNFIPFPGVHESRNAIITGFKNSAGVLFQVARVKAELDFSILIFRVVVLQV
jgi:hypothetical protein